MGTTENEDEIKDVIFDAVQLLLLDLTDDEVSLHAALNTLHGIPFSGWLVAWHFPFEGMSPERATAMGNSFPSGTGWNIIVTTQKEDLLNIVINAADMGCVALVIDLEEIQ